MTLPFWMAKGYYCSAARHHSESLEQEYLRIPFVTWLATCSGVGIFLYLEYLFSQSGAF